MLTAEYFGFSPTGGGPPAWRRLPSPTDVPTSMETYTERDGCAAAALPDGRVLVASGIYMHAREERMRRSATMLLYDAGSAARARGARGAQKALALPRARMGESARSERHQHSG